MNRLIIKANREAILTLNAMQNDRLTPLTVIIDDFICGNNPIVWIDYQNSRSRKKAEQSFPLANETEITIPDNVLNVSGILYVQARIEYEGVIWHSQQTFTNIKPSIDATEKAMPLSDNHRKARL